MAGTEQGLMLHLAAHLDAAEFKKLPPRTLAFPPQGYGIGTPNHKGLRVACWYLDSTLHPNEGARKRILDFCNDQQRSGHMKIGGGNEILSASHGQLWCALAGVPLWAAWQTGDTQVFTALQLWWRDHMALCDLCALPVPKRMSEPVTWAPGARAWVSPKAKGGSPTAANSARDLCYRLIYGLPVPAAEKPLWRQKYNLGPRALKMLPATVREQLQPQVGHWPKLSHELSFKRLEGEDFAAWFDELPDALEPALIAGRFEGRPWVEERPRAQGATTPRDL